MASASFSTLPDEVIEEVLQLLDEKQDLLSLALASSFLCTIIIPRHLYYRHIRCSIFVGAELWKILVSDRNLAQNVRVLELEAHHAWHERCGHVPASWPPPQLPPNVVHKSLYAPFLEYPRTSPEGPPDRYRELEKLFLRALRNMTSLSRFQWGYLHAEPSINIASGDPGTDVWRVLSTLGSLRDVEVMEHHRDETSTPIHDTDIWSLRHLQVFKYRSQHEGEPRLTADIERMSTMLQQQCPLLNSLLFNIDDVVESPRAEAIGRLLRHSYAYLRRACFETVECDMASACAFLEHNPSLEELQVDHCFGRYVPGDSDDEMPERDLPSPFESARLKPATLPSLRRLTGTDQWIRLILASHHSQLPPITHLRGLNIQPSGTPRDKTLNLLKRLPNLRRLDTENSMATSDLIAFGRVAPQVEWIELQPQKRDKGYDVLGTINENPKLAQNALTELLQALSKLHNLTALHGLQLFVENEPQYNNQVARDLLAACPNLRRTDLWPLRASYDTRRWRSRSVYPSYIRLNSGASPEELWKVKEQDDFDWYD